MATLVLDDVRIHYKERGQGFPILMLAPGGMRSSLDAWNMAPWALDEHLSSTYRVITMSQRNAGESYGPIDASAHWGAYANDQLALMDSLGVDQFHVVGMCIGVSHGMRLIAESAERVKSLTALQPIGLHKNRKLWFDSFDVWKTSISEKHPNTTAEEWNNFRSSMFGSQFVFSVDRDFASKCRTPTLILMGHDDYHPEAISRELASLMASSSLLANWKPQEYQAEAQKAIDHFLLTNTPLNAYAPTEAAMKSSSGDSPADPLALARRTQKVL